MRSVRLPLVLALCTLACSSSEPATPAAATDAGGDDSATTAETSGEALVVATDKGKVRGVVNTTGATFFDIPFAAAPVGPLRFAKPAPREPWTDVRDGTKRGLACPQGVDVLTKSKPAQQDDCLALNVWTPKLDPSAKAPVMVFIHGGSFDSGSGNMPLYDGENLSKRGVVVVTINYRLGALGFLAHPALPDTNFGLLDQQAALRWVQTNIAAFGGDPTNVTLFGESAGAISVCLQMVSASAKGLFHKAIAESGTCALVVTPRKDLGTPGEDSAEERGTRFATELGCTGADVVACLRGKSADEIVAKTTGGGIGAIAIGFPPNIDGVVVPNAPMSALKTGAINDVPYLGGANGDEATLFTTTVTIATAAEYEAAVRARNPFLADQLLAIYPASAFPTPKAAYDALLGEGLFVCPAREAARALSARVPSTFLYHYSYVPAFAKLYALGAFHASELWFVFGNWTAPLAAPTTEERALSEAIGGYWTRFAKTGDPNGEGAVAWPKYTAAADEHLGLTTPITAGAALLKQRCDALAKLVP